jgi:carotenoid cleavage dioxygenase-like enzyme
VAGVDDGNANTSVGWHAGRLLALKEAALPYELDPVTLATRGVAPYSSMVHDWLVTREHMVITSSPMIADTSGCATNRSTSSGTRRRARTSR